MKDKTLKMFSKEDVDDSVWEGHAFPPVVDGDIYLCLMKESAELSEHYKLIAYYDFETPALVIGFRHQRKLGLWQTRSTPILTKAAAWEMVCQQALDERISAEDVMFYTKLEHLPLPDSVN